MPYVRNGFGSVSNSDIAGSPANLRNLVCVLPSANVKRIIRRIAISFHINELTDLWTGRAIFCAFAIVRGDLVTDTTNLLNSHSMQFSGTSVGEIKYQQSITGTVNTPNAYEFEINLEIPPGEAWTVVVGPVAKLELAPASLTFSNAVRTLNVLGDELLK